MCRPCGPFGAGKVHSCSATFGRVALGHRPGRGGIEDQRALARDQRLVVRGVVPGKDARRKERHGLSEPLEHGPRRVVVDGDVALGVDQLEAIGVEHRADKLDRVAAGADRHAERIAALVSTSPPPARRNPRSTPPPAPCRAARRPGTSWSRRARRTASSGRCARRAATPCCRPRSASRPNGRSACRDIRRRR